MLANAGALTQQKGVAFMAFERQTGTKVYSATSVTLSFPTLTDATQCVPFLNAYSSDLSGGYCDTARTACAIDIWDDAGTVKATLTWRDASASNVPDIYLNLTLVEFFAPINVYKYSYTDLVSSTPFYTDHTITSVNTANAFAIATGTGEADSSFTGCSIHTGTEFLSGTSLRIHAWGYSTPKASTIVYVVEDPTATKFSVLHYPITFSTAGTSYDVAVAAHDESKTMCIASVCLPSTAGSYPNNTFANKYTFALYRQAATNYRFYRYASLTPTRVGGGELQLVTFNSGVSIQKDSFDFGTVDTIVDRTISSVDVSKSFAIDLFGTGVGNAASSSGVGGGAERFEAMVRCHVLNATTVRCQRNGYSTEYNQLFGYQVVTLA